jgi:hypothetical protein
MIRHAPSEEIANATMCKLKEGYVTLLASDCPDCLALMAAPAKLAGPTYFSTAEYLGLEDPDQPFHEVIWIKSYRLSLDGLAPPPWYRAEVYHLLWFGPDVAGGDWSCERGAIYDCIEGCDLKWLTSKTIRMYPGAKFALRVIEGEI